MQGQYSLANKLLEAEFVPIQLWWTDMRAMWCPSKNAHDSFGENRENFICMQSMPCGITKIANIFLITVCCVERQDDALALLLQSHLLNIYNIDRKRYVSYWAYILPIYTSDEYDRDPISTPSFARSACRSNSAIFQWRHRQRCLHLKMQVQLELHFESWVAFELQLHGQRKNLLPSIAVTFLGSNQLMKKEGFNPMSYGLFFGLSEPWCWYLMVIGTLELSPISFLTAFFQGGTSIAIKTKNSKIDEGHWKHLMFEHLILT